MVQGLASRVQEQTGRPAWYDGISSEMAANFSGMTRLYKGPRTICDAKYDLVKPEDAKRLYGKNLETDTFGLTFNIIIEEETHGASWGIFEIPRIKEFLGRMGCESPGQLDGKSVDVYLEGFVLRGIGVNGV
jgi:hypothetical protein